MNAHTSQDGKLIVADARKVSPGDFWRIIRGLPPLSAAEKAELQARHDRLETSIAIRDREFAIARAEREAILLEGPFQGESYSDWIIRNNAPFAAANVRCVAAMAEYDAKVAGATARRAA